MEPIIRAIDASLDLQAGERTLICTMTTDAIDRYGEVILPKGIDLAMYRKNPVVLWAHDQEAPPIGRSVWVKPDESKRGLIAKVQFAETDLATEIWELYRREFLRAFSIGARPQEGSPPTPDEVRKRTDLAACKWIWRKIELTELSCVPVPANPEALASAVSKGLSLSDGLRRRLGVDAQAGRSTTTPPPVHDADATPELPPLVGRTFGQAHAELVRSIRTEPAEAIARRLLADELDRVRGRV